MLKRLLKILNKLSISEYSSELEKDAKNLVKNFFREYKPQSQDLFALNDVICKVINLELFDRYQIFSIANVENLEDMAMRMIKENKIEVEQLTKLFLLEPGDERGYTLKCTFFNQRNILYLLIDSEINKRRQYYTSLYNFDIVVYILLYALSNYEESFGLVEKIFKNFYQEITDFYLLIYCFNFFTDSIVNMTNEQIEYLKILNKRLVKEDKIIPMKVYTHPSKLTKDVTLEHSEYRYFYIFDIFKTESLFKDTFDKYRNQIYIPLIEKIFQKCSDGNFDFVIIDMMRKKTKKGKYFLNVLYSRFYDIKITTKHIRLFFEYSIRESIYGDLKYPKMLYYFFRNLIGYIGRISTYEYTKEGFTTFYNNTLFNQLIQYNRTYFMQKFYDLENLRSQLFLFEQLFNIYYDKKKLDRLKKKKKAPKWRKIFETRKIKIRIILTTLIERTPNIVLTVIAENIKYNYKLYEGILKILLDFYKQNKDFIEKYKTEFDTTKKNGVFAIILQLFGKNEKLIRLYVREMGYFDYSPL